MSKQPRRALAAAVVLAAAVSSSRQAGAEPAHGEGSESGANNWNQLADGATDGVVRGLTKLSVGFDYARAGDDASPRLALEVEHLLRDRWGITGTAGVSVGGPTAVVPGSLGFRFHFLPKHAIDPYLALAGGLAWVHPGKGDDIIAPLVDLRVGLAVYLVGLSFVQLDGGYDFLKYAGGGKGEDLGGIIVTGRLGVFF